MDGGTTSLDVSGFEFVPNARWLAVVLAVDEAGATTAYVNFDRNALIFDIVADASPRIHVYSQLIEYTTPAGGGDISLEIPSNIQITFHWDGLAAPGRQIVSTRWSLDGGDWSQPRLAHLAEDTGSAAVQCGIYACSPKQAGLIARFHDFSLTAGYYQ